MLCDHLEGWDREGGRETQEGGEMKNYCLMCTEIQFCKMKTVLETDGGPGGTTVSMC